MTGDPELTTGHVHITRTGDVEVTVCSNAAEGLLFESTDNDVEWLQDLIDDLTQAKAYLERNPGIPKVSEENYIWNPDQEALAKHIAQAATHGESHLIVTTTAIGIPSQEQA